MHTAITDPGILGCPCSFVIMLQAGEIKYSFLSLSGLVNDHKAHDHRKKFYSKKKDNQIFHSIILTSLCHFGLLYILFFFRYVHYFMDFNNPSDFQGLFMLEMITQL